MSTAAVAVLRSAVVAVVEPIASYSAAVIGCMRMRQSDYAVADNIDTTASCIAALPHALLHKKRYLQAETVQCAAAAVCAAVSRLDLLAAVAAHAASNVVHPLAQQCLSVAL
eukprot:9804-Heterococcus_DN1.PRE.2